MSESTHSIRERAIERLAAVLWETLYAGRPRDTLDAERLVGLSADLKDSGHNDLPTRAAAERLVDELGLVAIDPALVAAVREAERDADRALDTLGTADAWTEACGRLSARRDELVRAVLAQIGGDRE